MTGITELMLAQAPIIDQVFPTFLEFAGSHQQTVLVAHNAPFDLGFLKSAAKELDYIWPKYKTLDTVTVARQVLTKEDVPDCKLGTLAQFFGCKTEPNHRALDDARATVEVFHGLLERLGSLNITTLDALLNFTKNARHIQRRAYWGLTST
jgi:DNA polymerase III epsilon subunit-like protein